MFARPFVLGDLNITRQIIRDTLAPTDYQISLLIRVDCSRDGIKLLHRIMSMLRGNAAFCRFRSEADID